MHGLSFSRRVVGPALLSLALGAFPAACRVSPAIDGLWDATVIVGTARVPFQYEISGAGAALKGSFFNGDDRITSTTAQAVGGKIEFRYPQYASSLELVPANGGLTGRYLTAAGR